MALSLKLRNVLSRFNTVTQNQVLQSIRPSSYKSSLYLEDVVDEVNRKYEVTQDPADWKYVERVLPLPIIPEPIKKKVYASGWKPQGDDFKDQLYFIERTKNHMIPVYLRISQKGLRRHTVLKKIQGDIWLLEKEIKAFLQEESIKPIRSQVHEFARYIKINGDFVNAIKYWLEKRTSETIIS